MFFKKINFYYNFPPHHWGAECYLGSFFQNVQLFDDLLRLCECFSCNNELLLVSTQILQRALHLWKTVQANKDMQYRVFCQSFFVFRKTSLPPESCAHIAATAGTAEVWGGVCQRSHQKPSPYLSAGPAACNSMQKHNKKFLNTVLHVFTFTSKEFYSSFFTPLRISCYISFLAV